MTMHTKHQEVLLYLEEEKQFRKNLSYIFIGKLI
uniref:Uncharacterized protein n=1 Tax=Podoviridae sp. ct8Lf7 TaxID=2827723 RepID=A0A8S5S126_9CAUD|nr:MAG TPA: hypothetical protein [Podoviridae sp. ct8Lf7]